MSGSRVGTGMRTTAIVAMMAAGLVVAAPAWAQTTTVDARLTQLEKRMNTVERVVSTRNGGPLVQPEIGPSTSATVAAGTPASAPLADLQSRIVSVEAALAGVTGRIETAEHRLSQLELDFAAYKKSSDARLRALEEKTLPTGEVAEAVPALPKSGIKAAPPTPKLAVDAGRAQRLVEVPKPTGKDAADKGTYSYNYGYRLWKAKLYPEAETQLEKFATRYPGHRLISQAQNTLGLVYLDDNRAKDAATIFFDNYSKMPDGARAPDSLLNLARALIALKRPATDVCQVYKELGDVYGSKLTPVQRAEADKGRATYKCH